MTYEPTPQYNGLKDLKNNVTSISGVHHTVKRWHKMLIGKNYYEVLEIIKNNPEENKTYVSRIIKVDDVIFPGFSEKPPEEKFHNNENKVERTRINLTLETNYKFKKELQIYKKIENWLKIEKNQKDTKITKVDIF